MAKPFSKRLDPGTKIFVVVSDVHVPYYDHNCAQAIAAFMREIGPDGFIVNGDYLDLFEVSSHNASSLRKLEGTRISEAFREGNKLLDLWCKAAGPKCKEKYFIDGNHEDRLDRWLNQGDNGVWAGDEAVDIGLRLKFKERGIVYKQGYPNAHVQLGKLLVTHGKYAGGMHAKKHLDNYRHSVMYGHTHSPQMLHVPTFLEKQGAYGTGHLAAPNSKAVEYASKPSAWVQGFSIVYVRKNGDFNVQLINFWNGTFFYGGRQYGKATK